MRFSLSRCVQYIGVFTLLTLVIMMLNDSGSPSSPSDDRAVIHSLRRLMTKGNSSSQHKWDPFGFLASRVGDRDAPKENVIFKAE